MGILTTPFAEALRGAIADRGVSLVDLRDRLAERGTAVSLTTLSYWRSGRRQPDGADSLAAVRALEELLGIAPGQLAAKLGPPRRRGSRRRPALPFGDAARRTAVQETFDALGATPMTRLQVLWAHVVSDVGENGGLRRSCYRVLMQATSGPVTEVPFLEILPEPTSTSPVVTLAPGASLSAVHHHPGGQIVGYAFTLDHSLEEMEVAVLEWTVDYPTGFPAVMESSCALTREAREVVVWVRFHPDRLPAWCEEFTHAGGAHPVDPGGATTVHAVRPRFGPGELGIRWGF